MSDDGRATPPPDADDSLGRVPTLGGSPDVDELGGFQLVAKLGRGGMGEVWKAYDPVGKRFVVIKLVPPDVQNAEEEMARVQETFTRIHPLSHQNICPVYLLGRDTRRGFFLVMKYIEGQTLSAWRRSYVARHGGFPLEQVVRVLTPVAEALDYAHRHNVIHRDVKPQNILVVGDAEEVVLADFGLAAQIHVSLSRVSQVRMDTSGTRPYMAPEQWRAGKQDARTDQYALGVVAFELLTGCLPFESSDFDILRACVLNDPAPEVEDQPPHVDRAVARALAKRREDRFPACREFIAALACAPTQAAQGAGAAAASPLPPAGDGPGVKAVVAPLPLAGC